MPCGTDGRTRVGPGRRAAQFVAASLLLTACAAGGSNGGAPTPTVVLDPAAYAEDLFDRTNERREADGVGEVELSTCAAAAATQRLASLSDSADLDHAPLDDVMAECGVSVAAENLSRAAASPEDVVDAWMESPGHRANILDPELTHLGVGCVEDGDEMLCSQIFLGP
ncbi:CAP domain-containing protein [Actinotalea sp. JY-7885]|uniref:CAP domain-containing protein n=1 Tax=Actinotalea sp. JY-7885 TaxID=2758576 RepID=UPI00165D9BB3|nr:CAP domain-containing protein [Actinotalea sp. JY-7885]